MGNYTLKQIGSFSSLSEALAGITAAMEAAGATNHSADTTKKSCDCTKVRAWVKQQEKALIVYLAIPGLRKEDFSLEFDKNGETLEISVDVERDVDTGEIAGEDTEDRVAYHFSRTLVLEDEIDQAATKAEYQNGILKITLPHAEIPNSRRVSVS